MPCGPEVSKTEKNDRAIESSETIAAAVQKSTIEKGS